MRQNIGTIIAFVLIGCGSLGRLPEGTPPDRPAPLTIEVDNQNWADVVVYLQSTAGGTKRRLRRVTSLSQMIITLPGSAFGSDRIIVEPKDGREPWRSFDLSTWAITDRCLELRVGNPAIFTTLRPC